MVHWYQWYDWWARNATIVVKKVNSRGLAFTSVQAHIAVNSGSVDIINYYIQYGWRIARLTSKSVRSSTNLMRAP